MAAARLTLALTVSLALTLTLTLTLVLTLPLTLAKAGTTSLYKYLMQHPEVVPAEDKELIGPLRTPIPSRGQGAHLATSNPHP